LPDLLEPDCHRDRVPGRDGARPGVAALASRSTLICMSMQAWLAAVHAVYFALTGIWPLVHMRSFLAVTGPKNDLWLVRMVGLLLLAVAGPIALAAWRGAVLPEVLALAVGSSAALAIIDVVYVARGTIRKIYLADAAAELVLVIAWAVIWFARP
jgi:hypothetical protein